MNLVGLTTVTSSPSTPLRTMPVRLIIAGPAVVERTRTPDSRKWTVDMTPPSLPHQLSHLPWVKTWTSSERSDTIRHTHIGVVVIVPERLCGGPPAPGDPWGRESGDGGGAASYAPLVPHQLVGLSPARQEP